MLKLFQVEGFKNFDYPLTLDFFDNQQYNFNQECIVNDILKTMVVYGKNASGKTNLGLAIFDLATHMHNKTTTPEVYDNYLSNKDTYQSAFFRYVFQFGVDEVDYSYKKSDVDTIIFESLTINNVLYFEYEVSANDEGIKTREFKEVTSDLNYDAIEINTSCLTSLVDQSNVAKEHPLTTMLDFVSNMVWFTSLDNPRFVGFNENDDKSNDYYDFIFKADHVEAFQKLLKNAGIKDKLVVESTPTHQQELCIKGKPPIPFFKAASKGTKALYNYFYLTRSYNVSFLFIDHFDSHYHFDLAKIIVNDLKQRNFQTILVSHNTSLLSNKIMRPDCYFILSDSKLDSLAKLTERELKEGHNLEKLYMNGEFNQ
jgi:AAA15 family ATPase/GTPase